MQVLVGSTALNHQLPKFRKPNDMDIWTDKPFTKNKGYDYKLIPTDILLLIQGDEYINGRLIASLDSIYTIKCSHLGWDNPNWHKHKLDLLYLKQSGCKLYKPLYDALIEFWKIELGTKNFLSLSKNKKDFFTDAVTYTYDHDWLHEQVSYPNKPMYTHCLKTGQDVLIDKEKFQLLTFEQQVSMFREEITVIAIERWIVNPNCKRKMSWVQAYINALKKTVTTLTKGWATEFIVLNMEYFIKPEYKYFKHALEATKDK